MASTNDTSTADARVDTGCDTNTAAAASAVDLSTLTPSELIARINTLESRLKSTTAQLAAFTGSSTSAATTTPSARDVPTTSGGTGTSTSTPPSAQAGKVKKAGKVFDFSRYTTRHVAFKFAYLGHRYNGYEHTNGGLPTVKPTIEEALWKALRKVRLIDTAVPDGCDGTFEVVFDEAERKKIYWQDGVRLEIDWVGTGLEYSKCGRTDRGVSAFGQVVSLRVRSSRPKRVEAVAEGEEKRQVEFDDIKHELPYISLLNSVLPPDIRVLAWRPDPDGSFDARFSCKERRYKYFFTNPAFCPTPGPLGLKHANGAQAPVREGWLDIEAMRRAAKKLEGLHDYRNFCKIDAGKQMTSCERRITFADIQEMPGGLGLNRFMVDSHLACEGGDTAVTNGTSRSEPTTRFDTLGLHGPKVYTFAVHGTAFLWHQVRCMVAVLFLVGQGLEQPEIVDELLDIAQNPGKPQYELADDGPLVLWDCVFPGDEPGDEGGVRWVYAGDEASTPVVSKKGESKYDDKFGVGGLVSDLWMGWREAKMKETLTAGLLGLALAQGDGTSLLRGGFRSGTDMSLRSQRIFAGSNSGRIVGDYKPIMQKVKSETLEAQNAKYAAGKQARRDLKKSQPLENE